MQYARKAMERSVPSRTGSLQGYTVSRAVGTERQLPRENAALHPIRAGCGLPVARGVLTEPQPQLVELSLFHGRGSAHERVTAGGCLGKRDHVADVLAADE